MAVSQNSRQIKASSAALTSKMFLAVFLSIVEMIRPRFGKLVIRPSFSSSRRASRKEVRETPIQSHRTRSTSRSPGANFPVDMASLKVSTTCLRRVGDAVILRLCSFINSHFALWRRRAAMRTPGFILLL